MTLRAFIFIGLLSLVRENAILEFVLTALFEPVQYVN
jgi:hypothetical protein